MAFPQGALLLLLAATIWAGPIPSYEDTHCASRCPLANKFGYEDGKTYLYDYTAVVDTQVVGSSDEKSSLTMTASAAIKVLSQCEYTLQLSGVTLVDSSSGGSDTIDGAGVFSEHLQQHPLRFAFVDGRVASLCPMEQEATWVLNIKRAVLSAFQNTMHDLHANTRTQEVDLSGACDINYEVLETSGTTRIKKIKDVAGCAGHHHVHSAIQDTPFTTNAKMQTPPVFDVTNECVQTFSDDTVLESVECTEVHRIRAFSNGANGAATSAHVTMTKTDESAGTGGSEGMIERRAGLVFEHAEIEEESYVDANVAIGILREICTASSRDIKPEVPGLFMDFVKALKRLDASSLGTLYRQAPTFCDKANKFYRDAIPNIKTAASLTLMKDLLSNGDVTGAHADIWLTSLAFMESTPTPEMLAVAKDILALEIEGPKASLSVSSMFHTYCEAHPDCEDEPSIAAALLLLKQRLRYNCRATNDQRREEVMVTLKSVGNLGHATTLTAVLGRCMHDNDNDMAIRVAAINAYRRMPCSMPTPEALNLLEDPNADSELRINVYRILMKCPSPSILEHVRHLLATEQINQVGSYMWTHLTNLMETKTRYKQEVRSILQDEVLAKAFDLDKRKFSRNIELSAYHPGINMGGSLESNVIWSASSFAPRSIDLNLTTECFGHSINFLEIGGRVEGVEKVLEAALKGKEPNEVLDGNYDSDTMTEAMSNTRAQVFMRIFGNELRYQDFLFSDLHPIETKLNYMEWLARLAEGYNVDVTHSMMLVSHELIVPTIAGMPLKRGVHGAATAHVKVAGLINLANIFSTPHVVDISGSIQPSGAMEMVYELGVDAFVASTGLKLVTSLHTSTSASVDMRLQNGNVFTFDVNTPESSQEILNMKSNLYLTKRSADVELVMFTAEEDVFEASRCSSPTLTAITGMELCGELSYPRVLQHDNAAWFPLTGPARASLVLNKQDTFNKYHFEAKYIQEGSTDIAKVAFNTPGSNVDRALSVDYNLNRDGRTVSLMLKSPWKKADLTGSYSNTNEMKSVAISSIIDDTKNYGVTLQVDIVQNRLNVQYRPRLEVNIDGMDPKTVTGTMIYRSDRRVALHINVNNFVPGAARVGFDAELLKQSNRQRERYEAEFAVTAPNSSGRLQGHVEKQLGGTPVYTSKMLVEYQVQGQPQQQFAFNNKLRDETTQTRVDVALETSMTTTKWPQFDWDVNVGLTREGLSGSFSVEGGLTDQADERINVVTTFTDSSAGEGNHHYNGLARLQVPGQNINYEGTLEAIKTGNDHQMDMTFDLPGRLITYSGRGSDTPEHHELHLQVQQNNEDLLVLDGTYNLSPRHELNIEATVAGFEPMKLGGHCQPQLHDFNTTIYADYGSDQYALAAAWAYQADSAIPRTFAFRTNWAPDQFIELTGKHQDTQEGWWSQTRDMVVSLAFASSFPPVESVGVSLNHSQTPDTMNTAAAIWWQVDQKLRATLQNRKLPGTGRWEATYGLQTPFSIQDIQIRRVYHFENNELSYTLNAQWDENEVNLVMNGVLDIETKRMESTIEITTTFVGYESISSTFGFNVEGNSLISNLRSTWSAGKVITVTITMTGNSNDVTTAYNGQVNIATPWEQFAQGLITYDIYKDANTIRNTFKLEQGDHAILDWNMEALPQNGKYNVDYHFFINVPELVDFKAILEHSHEAAHWHSMNTVATLQWADGQIIHVEHDVEHTPDTYNIVSELRLATPFRALPMLNSAWSTNNDGDTYSFHYQVERSPNHRTVLDLSVTTDLASPVFTVNGRLTTPYESFERLVIDASNTADAASGVWNTALSVEYGADNIIELTGSLGLASTKEFSVGLKTPFEQVQHFNISASFTGNLRDFSTRYGIIAQPYMSYNVDCTLDVSTSDINNIRMEKVVTTPEPYEHILLTHVLGDNGHYLTNFEYTITDYFSARGSHDMELDWPRLYHCTTTFEYEEGNPFELEVLLFLEETKDVSIVVKVPDNATPFHDFQVTITHQGTLQAFRTSADITGNGDELTHGYLDFNNGADALTLQVALHAMGFIEAQTTPLQLDITHTHPRTNFRNEISLTMYDGEQYGAVTTFRFIQPTQPIKFQSIITTPIAGYETNTVKWVMTQDAEQRHMTHDFNATYGSNNIINHFEMQRTSNAITLYYSLATPYEYVNSLTANITHSGMWDDMQQRWTVQHNEDRYSGNSAFRKTARYVRGSATFNVPRTYSVQFNHKGFSLTGWANRGEVRILRTRYTANSNFKLQGKNLEMGAIVNIPDEYGFGFNHTGPPFKFSNQGEVIVQGKHYIAASELRWRKDNQYASASYRIPEETTEYSATFTRTGPINNVQATAEVNNNGDRYSATGNAVVRSNSYRGNGALNILDKEYNAGFTINNLPNNFELESESSIDGKAYTLSATYNTGAQTTDSTASIHTPHEGYDHFAYDFHHSSSNGQEGSLTLTTPFQGYDSIATRVTYRPRTNGFTTVGNLETNNELIQNVGFEVSHESSQGGFRTSGFITHPQHSARFSVSHQGTLAQFTSGAMVEYNERKIEGEISSNLESRRHSADYVLNIILATPFQQLRSAQIRLTNHMTPNSGDGTLEVHHNDGHLMDLDFTGSVGQNSTMTVTIRQPAAALFTLNVYTGDRQEKAIAELTVDGDVYRARVVMRYPQANQRQLTLTLNTPSKQLTLSTQYAFTSGRITHASEVIWNEARNGRFHYEVEAMTTNSGGTQIWDVNLNVTVKRDVYRGLAHHEWTPGQGGQTRVTVDKLTITHALTLRQPGIPDWQSVLTIAHADRDTDVVFTTDGEIDISVPSVVGSVHLSIDGAELQFDGKLANESPDDSNILYVAESSFTMEAPDYRDQNLHHLFTIYYNNEKSGINNEFTIDTEGMERQVFNAKTEYIRTTPSLVIEVLNCAKDILLTITHEQDDAGFRLLLNGHVDDDAVRGELDWVKSNGFDVQVQYGEGRMGRMYAKMVTPTTASFEIYHEQDGEKIEDAVLSVRMNTTRLLHGRAHIRPGIVEDIMNGINAPAPHVYQMASCIPTTLTNQLSSIPEAMAPRMQFPQQLIEQATEKARDTIRSLKQLYHRNTFHIKDIAVWMRATSRDAVEFLGGVMGTAGQQLEEVMQTLQQQLVSIQEQLQLPQLSSVMAVAFVDTDWWSGVVEQAADQFSQAVDGVTGTVTEAFDNIRNHPKAQELQAQWDQLQDWGVNMDFLDDLAGSVQPDMDWLVDLYNEAVVDATDFYNDVLGQPEMSDIKSIADDFIATAHWAYDHYGLREQVDALQQVHQQGAQSIGQKLRQRINDYFQFNRTRITVHQPENWEVQMEVYLPIEVRDLNSFHTMPLNMRKALVEWRNKMTGYMPSDTWAIYDMVYKYKPKSSNIMEWIPPFKSHATLAGNHYMTFDRRFYDYSGSCSYVLARDVIDGLFAVVVNYDTSRNERSGTIQVDGHTIEFARGYKVNVDGIRSELPFMVGDTSVMRIGDVIQVDSPHGFTVVCDLPNMLCTVDVSGWYYGKTGGLFGTFDNEPFTDFRDPSNIPVEDASRLADAWTEGNHCLVTNHATVAHSEPSSDEYAICSRYFMEDESPFRPCFKQVNHTAFMQMCLNDLSSPQVTAPEDVHVCTTAAFYASECRRAGVTVSLPNACVSCEDPTGSQFASAIQLEGENVPQSADVVIVMSQATCTNDVKSKLQDLVNRLDVGLQAHGLQSNRYGLVGYGGEGIYQAAHSHTIDGGLMGAHNKIVQAVGTMPLFDTTYEDALAALEFAARYPFRAGVSKIIILVPCARCEEHSVSYGDVQQLLVDRDITLNTLMQHTFTVDKANPAASHIFGVDSQNVYSRRDFGEQNPVGDPALRSQVMVPKDLCTALTDLSGGALFSAVHMAGSRPQAQKKFMDVMSMVTAMKGGSPAECQVCNCLPPKAQGLSKSVCKPCSQPSAFFSIFPDLVNNFENFFTS